MSQYLKNKTVIAIILSNLQQLMLMLSVFLPSVLFSRFASKIDYGIFVLALSFITLLSILAMPGLHTVALKAATKNQDYIYINSSRLSLYWSFWGVPTVALIGAFYIWQGHLQLGKALLLGSLFFPFYSAGKIWMFYLKGKSKFGLLLFFQFIKSFLQIGVIWLLLLNAMPVCYSILAFVIIEAFLNSTFMLYTFRGLKYQDANKDTSWRSQGYALTLMNFSSMVFNKLDVIILGLLLPFAQVAIYDLVMKLIMALNMWIKSSIEAVLPQIYKEEGKSISFFYKFFFLLFGVSGLLSLIIPWVVNIFWGTDYIEVSYYAQLYVFVLPFYYIGTLTKHYLIKYELNWWINFAELISIFLTMIAYFILISLLGVMGGILASYLYFLLFIPINFYALWKFKIKL